MSADGSSEEGLAEKVFRACLRVRDDGRRFWDEWGLAQDVALLDEICQECASLAARGAGPLVSLGRSGLCLAPVLSLRARRPMYAAVSGRLAADRSDPIALLGARRRTAASVEITVVDSHRHTGRTQHRYHAHLASMGWQPCQLVVVVDFAITSARAPDQPVLAPLVVDEEGVCLDVLRRQLGLQSRSQTIATIRGPDFWDKPPREQARPMEPAAEALGRTAECELVDERSTKQYAVAMRDEERPDLYRDVWQIYRDPELLANACERILDRMPAFDVAAACSIWAIPLLVGICSAANRRSLPIQAVYFGDDRSHSSIGHGTADIVEGRRVLMCDDHLGTGQHALEIRGALEAFGAEIPALVVTFDNRGEPNRAAVYDLSKQTRLFALTASGYP